VHYPAYVVFALTGLKKAIIDGAPFAFVYGGAEILVSEQGAGIGELKHYEKRTI
jgi:hypothetical protein